MAILGFVGWFGPYGATAFAAVGIAALASALGAPVPRPIRVPARRR